MAGGGGARRPPRSVGEPAFPEHDVAAAVVRLISCLAEGCPQLEVVDVRERVDEPVRDRGFGIGVEGFSIAVRAAPFPANAYSSVDPLVPKDELFLGAAELVQYVTDRLVAVVG